MNTRLFIGNLAYQATQEEFASELASLSLLPKEVKVMVDRETGNGRGFAFVSFNTQDEADKALAIISGHIFYGRPLRVDYATDKPRTSSGPGSASRPPAPTGPHPGSGNRDGGWRKPEGRGGGGGGRNMGDWGDSDGGGGRRGRRGRGED